eukprot:SAG31_NODE_2001_length_6694_cov_7.781198_5_plen_47_part_01
MSVEQVWACVAGQARGMRTAAGPTASHELLLDIFLLPKTASLKRRLR